VKKLFSVLLVVGVVFVLVSPSWAGKKQSSSKASPKPEPLFAEVMVATAAVDEVDYQKRTLTLRGGDGRTLTVRVDKGVNNFDQIKKGDQVKAEVLDAVGVYVRKPDWPPAVVEAGNVAVAPKGKPPAAVLVDTLQLPGRVEAVDHAKRTVTLRSRIGSTRIVDMISGEQLPRIC